MNEAGYKFIKEQSRAIAKWNSENELKYKPPNWEDSLFQERLMRIGVEARAYEVDSDDLKNLISLTTASLQESWLAHTWKH